MASRLNPYINFADNARQAMEFYKDVFGGEPDFQHIWRIWAHRTHPKPTRSCMEISRPRAVSP